MGAIIAALITGPQLVTARFAWLGPLLARITVGWVFLWAGWGKLGALPLVIENFRGWGVPTRRFWRRSSPAWNSLAG